MAKIAMIYQIFSKLTNFHTCSCFIQLCSYVYIAIIASVIINLGYIASIKNRTNRKLLPTALLIHLIIGRGPLGPFPKIQHWSVNILVHPQSGGFPVLLPSTWQSLCLTHCSPLLFTTLWVASSCPVATSFSRCSSLFRTSSCALACSCFRESTDFNNVSSFSSTILQRKNTVADMCAGTT